MKLVNLKKMKKSIVSIIVLLFAFSLFAKNEQQNEIKVISPAEGNWCNKQMLVIDNIDNGEYYYLNTEPGKSDLRGTTNDNGDVSDIVFVNTHKPSEISISGEKFWDDNSNQDGIRPDSLTIELFADGATTPVRTVVTDADKQWLWRFDNLPEYSGGHKIVYTVEEKLDADSPYVQTSVTEGTESNGNITGIVGSFKQMVETVVNGVKTLIEKIGTMIDVFFQMISGVSE